MFCYLKEHGRMNPLMGQPEASPFHYDAKGNTQRTQQHHLPNVPLTSVSDLIRRFETPQIWEKPVDNIEPKIQKINVIKNEGEAQKEVPRNLDETGFA